MAATFETQQRKRNMTDSAPTTTVATKKTPVASVALATGVLTGLGSVALGLLDKTGLSRLIVELGGATTLTSLAGTFLHQIGLAKFGGDVEKFVTDSEERFEDVEAELTSLWNHFDAKVEEVKSAATAPVYPTVAATGATGPAA